MIRNETEYKEAVSRLAEEQTRLAAHRARLKETGLNEEEIKRVTDPMESFYLQFKEEVESYELGNSTTCAASVIFSLRSYSTRYISAGACEAAGFT